MVKLTDLIKQEEKIEESTEAFASTAVTFLIAIALGAN